MTAEPSRRGFARALWRLADLVQAAEDRRSFRSKAYRRAVWSLDDLPGLEVSHEDLLATTGIGPGIAALLDEYRTTGGVNQLIPLEEAYPLETQFLRRLPRMSPRMLRDLKGLGIETRSDLVGAIESGAAGTLRGAGPQTLELWGRILDLSPGPGFFPAHQAWSMATTLSDHITEHTGCWIDIAGSVRRTEEWVDRLDLVAVANEPDRLVEFLSVTAGLHTVSIGDDTIWGSTLDQIPVAVHLSAPEAAGTSLLWATGPVEHAMTVTRDPYPTEHEAYESAGLALVPAPARGLPIDAGGAVVRVEDLRGDLHVHSELSPDGRMTLDQIVDTARRRKYEYIAVTDHTQGLRFGGLDEGAIAAQGILISKVRRRHPDLVIVHGAELNIEKDGSLDLDAHAMSLLDFAVAGVHSHFGLDRDTQTLRIVRALEHPVVRVLAHPFGRRIGIRPPLDVDMEAVIDAAVGNDVALETNGHRDRLDLSADWIPLAAARGAIFAANSDAHRIIEMENISNAIATLQRAGMGPERVINTLPANGIRRWLSRAPSLTSGGPER